jgi:hypothetical protein
MAFNYSPPPPHSVAIDLKPREEKPAEEAPPEQQSFLRRYVLRPPPIFN